MIYIQLIIFRTGKVMSCFKSESFTEQVFFTVTCSCAPKRGFCFTLEKKVKDRTRNKREMQSYTVDMT